MRIHLVVLSVVAVAWPGCHGLERDNPFDAGREARDAGLDAPAALVLSVPLPKALAVVVDSLVARLEGPDMVPVVKALDYPGPLGPATLTLGALSPGEDRTLTIEGFDLGGRLILSGSRTGITVAARDTTRVAIDLRLTVPSEELGTGPGGGAADTTSGGGGGAGKGTG